MKDRKGLLILLLPIIVFVATFFIVKTLNGSYAMNPDTNEVSNVAEGTQYYFVQKNTYSHHLISYHFDTFGYTNAPGTKLIQSGNNQAIVYCATEGKTLSESSKRKRYSLYSSKVGINNARKNRLNIAMQYMYPYIKLGETFETEGSLKQALSDENYGIDAVLGGNYYIRYDFDNLNVNETVTAVQAAIWNIIKGKKKNIYHDYRGTITSFSAFGSCESYKAGKVLTTEEETWYSENNAGCSSNGKFYKYVYYPWKTSNTQNRINSLILWYIRLHYFASELPIVNQTSDHFDYQKDGSSFTLNPGSDSATLIAKFKTNMSLSDYTIVFTDQNNNVINVETEPTVVQGSGENLITYTISNVNTSVEQVNVAITSNVAKNNVYYYIASSGQDFVGAEKSYFTATENLSITRDKSGKIMLYKVGQTSNNVQITSRDGISNTFDSSKCGDGCLSNAKFELYYGGTEEANLIKKIETNYQDYGDYDSDSELEETKGELDLSSVIFDNLPLGTYYLKEIQPPYGYDLYNDGEGITNGFIRIDVSEEKTYDVVVNNNKTSVCISKIDSSSGTNILDNAVFQIKDIDDNVVEQFRTSSQHGPYCIEGQLQTGVYLLQEVEAPFGYEINTSNYLFTVGKDYQNIQAINELPNDIDKTNIIIKTGSSFTIPNKKAVVLSKSDITNGACVEGALLTIKDTSDNTVATWTSTCGSDNSTTDNDYNCATTEEEAKNNPDAYICTEHKKTSENTYSVSLPAGEYTLTETMTEELRNNGYSSESETITFTVDESGNVSTELDMKDAPIKACIYKVSTDSKEPLKGAVFAIYEKGSDKPYTTITTSNVKDNNCIDRIPFGTYIIKEIKAPNGYKISNEEIEIEIRDTKEKQEFYIEDEVVAPKTAFENTKILIIIASIFMIFGIGLVGYYGFKKQN